VRKERNIGGLMGHTKKTHLKTLFYFQIFICLIVGLFVYFFNDRLKKKYDILAKMWKIPVATYNQVFILPAFYVHVFCTKKFCAAFSNFSFALLFFGK